MAQMLNDLIMKECVAERGRPRQQSTTTFGPMGKTFWPSILAAFLVSTAFVVHAAFQEFMSVIHLQAYKQQ